MSEKTNAEDLLKKIPEMIEELEAINARKLELRELMEPYNLEYSELSDKQRELIKNYEEIQSSFSKIFSYGFTN